MLRDSESVNPSPDPGNLHSGYRLAVWALGLLAVLTPIPGYAYDVLLRWTVPPDTDITGYRFYSGAASRSYGLPHDVGPAVESTYNGVVYHLDSSLQLGTAYYVAATSYNSAGLESDYSNEKLVSLTATTPPPANAGPDQTGAVGSVFTLGSAPDAGIGYFWQQTAGPSVSLSSRTSSSTQFTAPAAGTYQFVLTVYDSQGVAAQSTVSVTAADVVGPTPTVIQTPGLKPTQTPTAAPYTVCGNANGDDTVDIVDALFISQMTVGLRDSLDFPLVADVNGDGHMDIIDALFIAQHTVGLRPALSCAAPSAGIGGAP